MVAVPDGGSARIALIRWVPACCPSTSIPTNITRPPRVVTTRASIAASRLARFVGSNPMSRKEKIVVSSQNTNSTSRSSARTSPSIAPTKAVKLLVKPTNPGVESLKYQVQ